MPISSRVCTYLLMCYIGGDVDVHYTELLIDCPVNVVGNTINLTQLASWTIFRVLYSLTTQALCESSVVSITSICARSLGLKDISNYEPDSKP
jgi:hypothetical protein